MKRHALRSTATALLGAGLLATASTPAASVQDLEPRVAALETELDGIRGQLEAMAEAKADLEAFLAAQRTSVENLRASLSTSEEKGFTAGINPESREVLLSGFRGYLDRIESALPASGDAEKKEPAKEQPKKETQER